MSRFPSLAAMPAALFLLVLAALPSAAGDSNAERAQSFVRVLAKDAVTALTGRETSAREREAAFRRLLAQNFDVPQIGKWALGRHWRVATPAEQAEYLALFEDFIVTTYAPRFREYTNEQLEVGDVKPAADEEGGLIVASQITRDNPKPIRVDWRLAPQSNSGDGGYKIVDIVVEGVSMVQTQRSEFGSVITRNGGKVGGLIVELKTKTQQLRAQAQ